MEINTSELFAPVYNKVFTDIFSPKTKHERWTFTGGRASCKSSFISICIVLLIVIFPKLNALVIRKTAKGMRNSVFNQIVWAIDKLNLRKTKSKKSGFKIPRSRTQALPISYVRKNGKEQVILFAGIDDPEKLKSLKVSNGYIGILWAEEKTEIDPQDLQNVRISALRGGEKFYIFESYNPPSAVRHWCNAEARQDDPRRMVIHTTYLDIPASWLGPAIMHDIENTKAHNERAYRNVYLGEATGTGRNIFENVQLRAITPEERAGFDDPLNGVDWGYYPDPFAYGSVYYDYRKNTLYVLDELYLWKHGNEAAFEKTEKHMKEHGLNIYLDRITADSAEPKSVDDWRNWGANTRGAIKGPHSKEAGFKWLQSLNAIVVDPAATPHAADEFSLFEYELDKRTGEIMSGYPEGQPDHFLALTRYATESVWRHAGA